MARRASRKWLIRGCVGLVGVSVCVSLLFLWAVLGRVSDLRPQALDLIERRMQQVAEHTCAAHEAQCEFHFQRNYPPTINSAAEAAFARSVMEGIVGADKVVAQEPTMGAEDFAYMLQATVEKSFIRDSAALQEVIDARINAARFSGAKASKDIDKQDTNLGGLMSGN